MRAYSLTLRVDNLPEMGKRQYERMEMGAGVRWAGRIAAPDLAPQTGAWPYRAIDAAGLREALRQAVRREGLGGLAALDA
jgi:hypothetical protein